jgi:hypothetical protein
VELEEARLLHSPHQYILEALVVVRQVKVQQSVQAYLVQRDKGMME